MGMDMSYTEMTESEKEVCLEAYADLMGTEEFFGAVHLAATRICRATSKTHSWNSHIYDKQGKRYVCCINISIEKPYVTPMIALLEYPSGELICGFVQIGRWWHKVQCLRTYALNWMDILPFGLGENLDREQILLEFLSFQTTMDAKNKDIIDAYKKLVDESRRT